MAEFSVNPTRFDPYKSFKFRVQWDGRVVAGVSSITALRRVTDVVEHREGGERSTARLSPGITRFDAITLARGRTHDIDFEAWAEKVWSANSGTEVALANFRKDVRIELFNEAGQLVLAWTLYRCWPSEYVALGDLDANGESAAAFERLTLQCEGWVRDPSVPEPQEPS